MGNEIGPQPELDVKASDDLHPELAPVSSEKHDGTSILASPLPTGKIDESHQAQEGRESEEHNDDAGYPSGFAFVALTVGLMAVVLQVALDNYIIGETRKIPFED